MLRGKIKRGIMLALALVMLISVFASCNNRREQYEEELESKQEQEEQNKLPQAGSNIIGTIINAEDWQVYALKQGEGGYFEGKSEEELYEIYEGNSNENFGANVLPKGRTLIASDGSTWFFNKMTGNISAWCPDPMCEGGEKCMFSGMWNDLGVVCAYAGEQHLYFISYYKDFTSRLYRCDYQRNNVEMLYVLPTYTDDGQVYADNIDIIYEKDNLLYFIAKNYVGVGTLSIQSVKTLDMDTGKVNVVSGDIDVGQCFVENNEVYYTLNTYEGWYDWYKTDLEFSKIESLFEDPMLISNHTKDYFIISEWKGYGVLTEDHLYVLDTGESIPLGKQTTSVVISGDYIYYTKTLTDEEIENDPNKEYFLWKDPERPNTLTSQRTNARIFRRQIGSDEEELVFQMYYQGVPVLISDFYVDGECLWMEVQNHEQYRNYFNQDFGGRSSQDRLENEKEQPKMSSYLIMVDLHSGTVRFIELEDMEGIRGIW